MNFVLKVSRAKTTTMDYSVIDNTLMEMRSDKVAMRLKAFNKFYDLLQSRSAEVQQLAKRDDDFSWEDIFRSAHQGTVQHARKLFNSSTELLETDPKIAGYTKTLILICESPHNGEKIEFINNFEFSMLNLCFQSLAESHKIF